jgi:DNA-binding transcriptional LysR family regulator
MEREGIDVAIRDCPLANAPAGAVHLVGEHLAAICSPEYLREAKRRRKPLARPADLRHHVLLNLHDPTGRWTWLSWAAWLESMGVEELPPEGTVTFDQYDQVLQAALHGQGIALGRLTLSRQHIRAKRLVLLFGQQQRLARAYHAVYSSGARARAEAVWFVEWLQREIQREG